MVIDLLLVSVLVLVGVANGSPILAKKFLNDRFNVPLDCGRRLPDGQPVLGPSKTIRGLVVSICTTTFVALLLGFEWTVGTIVAVGAMAGDLVSSFVKRRLRLKSEAQAVGLDQIPEVLFPLLLLKSRLGLSASEIAGLVTMFVVLVLVLSRFLFRAGIRDRPY
jgi:CDP-archaeol synthase